jgi:hypothetical protein
MHAVWLGGLVPRLTLGTDPEFARAHPATDMQVPGQLSQGLI